MAKQKREDDELPEPEEHHEIPAEVGGGDEDLAAMLAELGIKDVDMGALAGFDEAQHQGKNAVSDNDLEQNRPVYKAMLEELRAAIPHSFKDFDENNLRLCNNLNANNTISGLLDHEGGVQLLTRLDDRLKQRNLRLGKYLGSGSVSVVFQVENATTGEPLEGVVARIDNTEIRRPLESPFITQPFFKDSLTSELRLKMPPKDEPENIMEEVTLNDTILLRGVKHSNGMGNTKVKLAIDPDNPEEHDKLEILGNIIRTLGMMRAAGEVRAFHGMSSYHHEFDHDLSEQPDLSRALANPEKKAVFDRMVEDGELELTGQGNLVLGDKRERVIHKLVINGLIDVKLNAEALKDPTLKKAFQEATYTVGEGDDAREMSLGDVINLETGEINTEHHPQEIMRRVHNLQRSLVTSSFAIRAMREHYNLSEEVSEDEIRDQYFVPKHRENYLNVQLFKDGELNQEIDVRTPDGEVVRKRPEDMHLTVDAERSETVDIPEDRKQELADKGLIILNSRGEAVLAHPNDEELAKKMFAEDIAVVFAPESERLIEELTRVEPGEAQIIDIDQQNGTVRPGNSVEKTLEKLREHDVDYDEKLGFRPSIPRRTDALEAVSDTPIDELHSAFVVPRTQDGGDVIRFHGQPMPILSDITGATERPVRGFLTADMFMSANVNELGAAYAIKKLLPEDSDIDPVAFRDQKFSEGLHASPAEVQGVVDEIGKRYAMAIHELEAAGVERDDITIPKFALPFVEPKTAVSPKEEPKKNVSSNTPPQD